MITCIPSQWAMMTWHVPYILDVSPSHHFTTDYIILSGWIVQKNKQPLNLVASQAVCRIPTLRIRANNTRPPRRNSPRPFWRFARSTNIYHQPHQVQWEGGHDHPAHRYLWTWLHQYPACSWWMVKTRLEGCYSRFIRWWSSTYWRYPSQFLTPSVAPCADLKAIHPKKRDQDTKSILEKAGDTVTTTVDVGPWMYNHREAGEPFSQRTIEEPLTE